MDSTFFELVLICGQCRGNVPLFGVVPFATCGHCGSTWAIGPSMWERAVAPAVARTTDLPVGRGSVGFVRGELNMRVVFGRRTPVCACCGWKLDRTMLLEGKRCGEIRCGCGNITRTSSAPQLDGCFDGDVMVVGQGGDARGRPFWYLVRGLGPAFGAEVVPEAPPPQGWRLPERADPSGIVPTGERRLLPPPPTTQELFDADLVDAELVDAELVDAELVDAELVEQRPQRAETPPKLPVDIAEEAETVLDVESQDDPGPAVVVETLRRVGDPLPQEEPTYVDAVALPREEALVQAVDDAFATETKSVEPDLELPAPTLTTARADTATIPPPPAVPLTSVRPSTDEPRQDAPPIYVELGEESVEEASAEPGPRERSFGPVASSPASTVDRAFPGWTFVKYDGGIELAPLGSPLSRVG